MVQDNQFSFDTTIFPLPTNTGNTILTDSDPVSTKILQFYRGILQGNLGDRWAQECIACGMINSNLQNLIDGYIVGDAICYPVPTTLKQTDYKFPLLSVYRNKETYRQMTTMKIVTESDFKITWTLPPLNSPAQLNHLYPFLAAVSKTILFYTFEGSDPKYNNGELVWKNAGFSFATIDNADIGSFLGQDGKTFFPSLKISLKVFEQNQFVPANYEAFTGFDGSIDELDGYNINNPYPNLVQFITNPGLTISSFNTTSGSINGGTQVIIQGTGFQVAKLSQQQQIVIAGGAVQSFLVVSDTTIIAVTGYVTAPSVGPITITDNQGNMISSVSDFSYVA